jgi:hypothetical protein
MLSLSSTAEAAAEICRARDVAFTAYTLRRGAVFSALEASARAGSHVTVRLEGAPFGDADGSFARANAGVVAELRRAGVDASVSAPGDAPIHAKMLRADGEVYLDDRNWGAADVVVRDDAADPALTVHKREALASEAQLLRQAQPAEDPIVESESFGCCNAVYSALEDAAKRGLRPRLLVCSRELRGSDRERERLVHLAHDGVQIRTTPATDKFALAGEHLWIGSANATAAIAMPDTIDWGIRTDDASIVNAVRARVETTWKKAKPLSL